MSNKTDALHKGLQQMLNYLPMIYNQQASANTGEIIIKYPYSSIPNNALLFVLPLYNSAEDNENIPNKLTIKFAQVSQDGTTVGYSKGKQYNILVEDTNGTKRRASKGDIVANRLCMFRFISNNATDIILCNNPVYNNLKCSTLCITNSTKFYEIPKFVTSIDGVEKEINLALESKVQELITRVDALEKKFRVGTKSAEEFFEENPNEPKGTIYLQVEE
jgi:hypothetical protein